MKRKVIVGATSAMAEHVARLWVKDEAIELVLMGRDEQKLSAIARDLEIRNPHCQIKTMVLDFLDAKAIERAVHEVAYAKTIDSVLIAHGLLPSQKNCEADLALCKTVLEVNAISPVLFAEAFLGFMEPANHGSLAIIGSVAGDRGRKSNYLYGSAKGLLARFVQGAQHRLMSSKVHVFLIQPGPTDTPMTAALKNKGLKLASVEAVAADIERAFRSKQAVVYAPRQWRFIMMIIKLLPRPIFNRLNL